MARSDVTFELESVVLRVHDLAAALAWYRDALGVSPTHVDERARRAVFELGEASVWLWQLRPIDRELVVGYAGTFPRLVTDDLERAWHQLRDRGVLVEPMDASGRSFELRDLDGNRLDVVARASR